MATLNWTEFLVPIPNHVQVILVVLFVGAILWWKIEKEFVKEVKGE